MTDTVEQKSYWNLLETVMWICTRDEERVAAMWDMGPDEQMALTMFDAKPELDPSSLLIVQGANPNANRECVERQENSKSTRIEKILISGAKDALDDVLRKVRSRRIQMTAIRCHGDRNEQDPVAPTELNDLIFRLHPGYSEAPVGLWSRSRNTLIWRSPQFSRADVIGVWPGRNKRTAAVSAAILRHLRQISTPQAPLTKIEAQQRCMTEVPNAYPEAFKKAWANLESSYKRGRGQHGPRVLGSRNLRDKTSEH